MSSRLVTYRRAVKPAVPAVLLGRAVARPCSSRPARGSLWPAAIMLAVAAFSAAVADFTQEAWPLAVLLGVPVAAFAFDCAGRWWPPRAGIARRRGRILADRRPVLLRPVLVLGDSRPARITAKAARVIIQVPPPISPRLLRPRRPSRLISRVRLT